MKKSMKKTIYLLISIIVILLVFLASFWDNDAIKKITGRASTTQLTNVSVSVVGANPITLVVYNNSLSNVDPTENALTNVLFYSTVDDPDGVADINGSSIKANFTRSNEVLRQETNCSFVANINTTAANYSCSVALWYYDGSGQWNISVRGTDYGNLTVRQNTSRTFQYNQLQAIVLSPNSISFPSVSPGATNQTSTNHPTRINNTGNYNISLGNVSVKAVNLAGETDNTKLIYAANFTVSNNTGGSPPVECQGTIMVNGTATRVTNTILSRGNHSLMDNSTGQETLFYCLKEVPPDLSSQVYSTLVGGSWTISIA